jgi:trimeric autotransporter adhesin
VGGTTYNDVGSALGALPSSTLVQQTDGSPGAGQITIGAATGGTSLSVAGTSGNRTLTGVQNGALTPSSTDAVSGGQLFTTNTNVANLSARVGTVEGDVTAIQADVASLANGTSGLVQQAVGAAPITVGAATGGTMLNVAGTAGNRTVTGVAAGAVNASSADAVNGAQLFAVETVSQTWQEQMPSTAITQARHRPLPCNRQRSLMLVRSRCAAALVITAALGPWV